MYAQGGLPNLKGALSYYARVIELANGENARALYGAAAARAAISGLSSGRSGNDGDLGDLSRQQLVALYEQYAPDKVSLVQGMVDAQT